MWSMSLLWPAGQDSQEESWSAPTSLAFSSRVWPQNGCAAAGLQSTLSTACGLAAPCLAHWRLVHLSIARVRIAPC